ncbi:MAG: hypothetical protein M3Q57_00140 [Pseudomonadota bacterium]|nr:hypothetical protein [Pseudomonadota bacterium]
MEHDDILPLEDQPPFAPVPVRRRHDGWTTERQVAFIEALADTACVTEACRIVGMSDVSAYALRRRFDARSFRAAWDGALDLGVARLADAAMCRAIKGVARPIFHKGEQVGEWREHDERLTMFLLRYRDPVRFGPWLDGLDARQAPDGPAMRFAMQVAQLERDAWADEVRPRTSLEGLNLAKPGSTALPDDDEAD